MAADQPSSPTGQYNLAQYDACLKPSEGIGFDEVWTPTGAYCSTPAGKGDTAAPCARSPGAPKFAQYLVRVGARKWECQGLCDNFGARADAPSTKFKGVFVQGNNPFNNAENNSLCFCEVEQYESAQGYDARRTCCANLGPDADGLPAGATGLGCDPNFALQGGCLGSSHGVVPPNMAGQPVGTVQSNFYCAPEHCYSVTDTCDDVMASIALGKVTDAAACQEVPSGGCGADLTTRAPTGCSLFTASKAPTPTSAAVQGWAAAALGSNDPVRARWVDYAMNAHCSAPGGGDETCACLNANESSYVDPCLGKTFKDLMSDFEATFGAQAVQVSGIASRKACFLTACDESSSSRFLQTSTIRASGKACPNVAACLAEVQKVSTTGKGDLLCVSQNCSGHTCQQAAAVVQAAVAERGTPPAGTGDTCPACVPAVNAALVGTGVRVGGVPVPTHELAAGRVVGSFTPAQR